MGEARAATSDSAQYVDTAGSLKNIGRIKAATQVSNSRFGTPNICWGFKR